MIVSDIMTTNVVTVEPDDTLAHAAKLLRQHQFHHLPVARVVTITSLHSKEYTSRKTHLLFEGVLTSQDIELAAALTSEEASSEVGLRAWQEQRVSERMQQTPLCVTSTTSVGSAAQLLVERGIDSLPVVEYEQGADAKVLLVGLLTRSDLLLALARALGTYEPGMQVDIALPTGSIIPLAQTLMLAADLHIPIRSILAAPLRDGMPYTATLRVGTINPSPLLVRLHEANIQYTCVTPQAEGEING